MRLGQMTAESGLWYTWGSKARLPAQMHGASGMIRHAGNPFAPFNVVHLGHVLGWRMG